MQIAALVFRGRSLNQVTNRTSCFTASSYAWRPFSARGQFGVAQHAGFAVAAGPGDDRRRAGGEQVDPVERAVLRR